jgi:ribosomal protein S18 acetylase RimI-like enzyme
MGEDPGVKVSVQELSRAHSGEAAQLLSEAFLDYPAFLAIGPQRPGPRRTLIRNYFRSQMAIARGFGGRVLAAAADGEPVGVALVFEPGHHDPPAWTVAYHAPFLLFGPGAVARGIRVLVTLGGVHPDEPHVFLSAVGVRPARQRSGAGRALVGEVVARAEELGTPAFLHTARPENRAYYRAVGFEEVHEGVLPRGHRFWSMLRPG